MFASDDLRAYRRARVAFSAKVYGLLIFWLGLALIQWVVVCLIEDARSIFKKLYYISLVAFALAVLLLAIFIFADGLRFMQVLNFIISLIIVELQIIATLILVGNTWWAELLAFFALCAVLIFIFLLIGIILPRSLDLTLDIAVLFIVAFLFLIIAVFVLTLLVCLRFPKMYTYLTVEVAVTLSILLFVIYHAQTIHGNRFAEMRLNDFFLGSLILFHDFLIIFWLTFYWQIRYRPLTPESFVATSQSSNKDNRLLSTNFDKGWTEISLGTIYTEQPWEDGKSEEYGEPYDPDRSRNPNEDQDEDSSQHRQVTKNREVGNWGYSRKKQRKPKLKTTPMDWSAVTETTEVSDNNQERSVPNIVKPFGEFRNRGVLYKVEPVDGRQLTEAAANKFGDNKIGSDNEYGDAKGKPEVGSGIDPSVDFSMAPLDSQFESSVPWELGPVGPEEIPQWNESVLAIPIYLGDEMHEQKGAEQPLPDYEILSQEQLKNLSDSRILPGKERDTSNPRAEPLTTSGIQIQRLLPDFQKLVMNNSIV